jgi:hypothetical protein
MEKNIQEIAKEIAAEIISRGNDSGREYIVYKSGLWEALYQGQQRLNEDEEIWFSVRQNYEDILSFKEWKEDIGEPKAKKSQYLEYLDECKSFIVDKIMDNAPDRDYEYGADEAIFQISV